MTRWALRAAIVLGLVACSTPDSRTEQERAADRALTEKVVLALLDDRYLDADHIEVEARRGIVRLSGKVGAGSELRGAVRIAAGVAGVRRVDDELEIMDFGRFGDRR
ncbi:MAG: BON domain-containing protein [Burkholderiaceae bacterium]|nr:BON domain-containing protein [Burkholderiaceae bacterium]